MCAQYRIIDVFCRITVNHTSPLPQAQAFAKLKRSASTYSFDGKTTPIPLYDRDVVNPEDLPALDEPSCVAIPQEQEEDLEDVEEREPTAFDEFQTRMRSIVNHSVFETFITLCILFNTLAMALEHYNMDHTFSKVLEYFNLVSALFSTTRSPTF